MLAGIPTLLLANTGGPRGGCFAFVSHIDEEEDDDDLPVVKDDGEEVDALLAGKDADAEDEDEDDDEAGVG